MTDSIFFTKTNESERNTSKANSKFMTIAIKKGSLRENDAHKMEEKARALEY
jgi:hypothetical protein